MWINLRGLITDPASKFTIAPLNTTKYADFLARTGQIKSRPDSWKDLFLADIHAEPGS